jgi:hypothetical protein
MGGGACGGAAGVWVPAPLTRHEHWFSCLCQNIFIVFSSFLCLSYVQLTHGDTGRAAARKQAPHPRTSPAVVVKGVTVTIFWNSSSPQVGSVEVNVRSMLPE